MNGISYLLDTCFLLEFYKQKPDVLSIITQQQIRVDECAISRINRIEVLGYAGLTTTDEKGLTQLLANFTCLPLNDAVEESTIVLRKQHSIKLPDAIILATANVYNLQLLTLDKKLQNKMANFS